MSDSTSPDIRLRRIEAKVDALRETVRMLVQALADDEDDEPSLTLEGDALPGERDPSQSLD